MENTMFGKQNLCVAAKSRAGAKLVLKFWRNLRLMKKACVGGKQMYTDLPVLGDTK